MTNTYKPKLSISINSEPIFNKKVPIFVAKKGFGISWIYKNQNKFPFYDNTDNNKTNLEDIIHVTEPVILDTKYIKFNIFECDEVSIFSSYVHCENVPTNLYI